MSNFKVEMKWYANEQWGNGGMCGSEGGCVQYADQLRIDNDKAIAQGAYTRKFFRVVDDAGRMVYQA
jgi:hypothetical protein